MSRIDLHLHTTHSDGSLPPAEVLALAQKAGVSALAITDHDIVAGIPEALETGARLGIEVIPGIEISSVYGENELHMLGYFLDWKDVGLSSRLAQLRASRHRRNPRIIEKLNHLGLDLSYEEVKILAGTESIGRPHIARVLMDRGYVQSAKEAFDRYLAKGAAAYVPRELPEPAEAIAWIRAARDWRSTSRTRSSAPMSIDTAASSPRGSSPPTTLVPPPNGIAAAPADEHQSSRRSRSASSRGRATTSGGLSIRPRNARTRSRYALRWASS